MRCYPDPSFATNQTLPKPYNPLASLLLECHPEVEFGSPTLTERANHLLGADSDITFVTAEGALDQHEGGVCCHLSRVGRAFEYAGLPTGTTPTDYLIED